MKNICILILRIALIAFISYATVQWYVHIQRIPQLAIYHQYHYPMYFPAVIIAGLTGCVIVLLVNGRNAHRVLDNSAIMLIFALLGVWIGEPLQWAIVGPWSRHDGIAWELLFGIGGAIIGYLVTLIWQLRKAAQQQTPP